MRKYRNKLHKYFLHYISSQGDYMIMKWLESILLKELAAQLPSEREMEALQRSVCLAKMHMEIDRKLWGA